MFSDVHLKNIYTVHKDSSGGTSVFAKGLKPAGCHMPPLLTNQNCTPLPFAHRTGEISFPKFYRDVGSIMTQGP